MQFKFWSVFQNMSGGITSEQKLTYFLFVFLCFYKTVQLATTWLIALKSKQKIKGPDSHVLLSKCMLLSTKETTTIKI